MIEGLIPKSIFDEDFGKGHIGFCTEKTYNRLYDLKEGTVYVPNSGNLKYIPIVRRTRLELLGVDNPRKAFADVLRDFKPELKTFKAPSAKVGKNTVIHKGTIIEHDVVIGDNCTIGGTGFGYEDGELIPHKGNVVIKAGAHIGNNVCIDRAVIGSTLIGENVRIDNLVHIAHGVQVGEGSMIIALAMIAGSVRIGKNVWIAPSASIIQKIKIGDNAVIGLGSVVLKDVKEGQTVYGNPAKPK